MRGSNRIKSSVYLLFAAFLFFLPFGVSAEERILNYDVQITINQDSTIEIFETIEYDFGDTSRHGIFRDIPVKYDANIGKRSVRIKVKSVSRDGFPEQFTEKRSGDDKRLRIGDPEKTISGVHTYRIAYKVGGAFNSFDTFDELYWNAIPHGWNVSIDNTSVKVTAPAAFTDTSCYSGTFGSTDSCTNTSRSGDRVEFSHFGLDAYEGVSIAVALPKGTVELPGLLQQLFWWLASNFFIFIPFFVFLYMYRLWDEKGRDAKGRGTIIARYDAPIATTPIFLGTLVDGQLNDRDITAGILYLAEQGFLTIARKKEKRLVVDVDDYVLEWVGEVTELSQKEKLIAKLLFGDHVGKGDTTSMSRLKKDVFVHKRRKNLKEHIDVELQRQGYFANRPHKVREMWMVWPIVLGSFLFVFWFINILLSISLALSLIIIFTFGVLMPKRTFKGAEIRDHILGFKEFLVITESERLDFHNAPERSSKEFMENLPYAVALGVEKKWAAQFKGIHIESPSWYRGGSVGELTTAAFVSDLNTFSSSMSQGVTATASSGGSGSSGGGFSGGGMGGGGGGSW